jgi:hypothetical protein
MVPQTAITAASSSTAAPPTELSSSSATLTADITTAGYVKQFWTDSNRENCYPIATLINNCDIGELLRGNVVAAMLDRVHYPLQALAEDFPYPPLNPGSSCSTLQVRVSRPFISSANSWVKSRNRFWESAVGEALALDRRSRQVMTNTATS